MARQNVGTGRDRAGRVHLNLARREIASAITTVPTLVLAGRRVMSAGAQMLSSRLVDQVSGAAALALLAVAVVGGLSLSTATPGGRRGSMVRAAHTFVAVGSVVFTTLHILSVLTLPELGVGWVQVLVPFSRAAGPVAQACGLLAADLLVAIGITSGLRRWLTWRWWWRIHRLTVPLFGLACAHTALAEPRPGSPVVVGLLAVAFTLAPCLVSAWLHDQPTVTQAPTAQQHHPLSLLISQRTWEADGVVSLLMVSPDGAALPAWRPGAHVTVRLPSGRMRCYSLCGDPRERDRYRIAVLRQDEGRGGSREMHEALRVGTTLAVDPPRHGITLEPAPHYLLLAGGIGITAMLPMARALAARGRPWRLVYIGRSRSRMPFLTQAEELSAAPDRRVVEIVPTDERGRPDLKALIQTQPPGTAVYCCGPASMTQTVARVVAARPALRIYLERFSSSTHPVARRTGREANPIEITLRRTGHTVTTAEGQTILQALQHLAPRLAGGCEQGICGRCRTKVLEGTPEHRDALLTTSERAAGQMLLCVSWARGDRLVLDL